MDASIVPRELDRRARTVHLGWYLRIHALEARTRWVPRPRRDPGRARCPGGKIATLRHRGGGRSNARLLRKPGRGLWPIPGSTPVTRVYVPVDGRVYRIDVFSEAPGEEGLDAGDRRLLGTLRVGRPSASVAFLGLSRERPRGPLPGGRHGAWDAGSRLDVLVGWRGARWNRVLGLGDG